MLLLMQCLVPLVISVIVVEQESIVIFKCTDIKKLNFLRRPLLIIKSITFKSDVLISLQYLLSCVRLMN